MKDDQRRIQVGLIAKDQEVLREIIEEYTPYLVRVCSSIITANNSQQLEEIDEVIQDTFLFIWQSPKKFDPNKAALKTFLSIKAASLAKNRLIKMNRWQALTEKIKLFSFSDLPPEAPFPDEILEIILSFDDVRMRDILLRRFVLEQTPKQIKAETGLEEKTIYNLIYAGKKKFRTLSEEGYDDFTTRKG